MLLPTTSCSLTRAHKNKHVLEHDMVDVGGENLHVFPTYQKWPWYIRPRHYNIDLEEGGGGWGRGEGELPSAPPHTHTPDRTLLKAFPKKERILDRTLLSVTDQYLVSLLHTCSCRFCHGNQVVMNCAWHMYRWGGVVKVMPWPTLCHRKWSSVMTWWVDTSTTSLFREAGTCITIMFIQIEYNIQCIQGNSACMHNPN